jgi:hypothetical protein
MKNLVATTDRMVGPVRHPTWTKLISAMIWLAVENRRTSIRRSLEGSERNAGLSDKQPLVCARDRDVPINRQRRPSY